MCLCYIRTDFSTDSQHWHLKGGYLSRHGRVIKKIHTFGCLVQYLQIGADKDPKSAKFASRTSFGIFPSMPMGHSGCLIFDLTRASSLVRSDVKFFDDIPDYPRLMSSKAKMQATPPYDEDFFTHFLDEDYSSPAPASAL